MMAAERMPDASRKTLRILHLLMRHFAHGLTNVEIAKALELAPTVVLAHVNALEAEGFAERVPETNRIRPSTRLAQDAVGILRSLEAATSRFNELQTRINQGN